MKIANLLKIVKCKLRNAQRGEIATLFTLISVGLMLVGVVVGNAAVQKQTRTQSKAAPSAVCPASCPNITDWSCLEEPYAPESCCADDAKKAPYIQRYTNPDDAWKWDAGGGSQTGTSYCGGAAGIEKSNPPPGTATPTPTTSSGGGSKDITITGQLLIDGGGSIDYKPNLQLDFVISPSISAESFPFDIAPDGTYTITAKNIADPFSVDHTCNIWVRLKDSTLLIESSPKISPCTLGQTYNYYNITIPKAKIASLISPPPDRPLTCAQITTVSYSADNSPVKAGDKMTCTVSVVPDPNNPADINTISCGWSKNGAWPMTGGRWENVSCTGSTCTFGIKMDSPIDPSAAYELVGFDTHWDCGPGKGKTRTINVGGGTPVPTQAGCADPCCGKPDGYGYAGGVSEQCDPNYKGGRWVLIDMYCQGGKPAAKPGGATCDKCDPFVDRIRETQASSIQRNETTPGGCDNPTGQNKCELGSKDQTLNYACTQCIIKDRSDLRKQFDQDPKTIYCTNQQMVNYWCNGGYNIADKESCKSLTETGGCKADCVPPPDGKECPLTTNQSPSLSDACARCVFLGADLKNSQPFQDKIGVCNPKQIANYWCNGGINDTGKNQCKKQFTDGFCDQVCNPEKYKKDNNKKSVSQDGKTACGLPRGNYFKGFNGNTSCIKCIAGKEKWLLTDQNGEEALTKIVSKINKDFGKCDANNLAEYWCSGGRSINNGEQNNQSSIDCKKKYIDDKCKTECSDVTTNKSISSDKTSSSKKTVGQCDYVITPGSPDNTDSITISVDSTKNAGAGDVGLLFTGKLKTLKGGASPVGKDHWDFNDVVTKLDPGDYRVEFGTGCKNYGNNGTCTKTCGGTFNFSVTKATSNDKSSNKTEASGECVISVKSSYNDQKPTSEDEITLEIAVPDKYKDFTESKLEIPDSTLQSKVQTGTKSGKTWTYKISKLPTSTYTFIFKSFKNDVLTECGRIEDFVVKKSGSKEPSEDNSLLKVCKNVSETAITDDPCAKCIDDNVNNGKGLKKPSELITDKDCKNRVQKVITYCAQNSGKCGDTITSCGKKDLCFPQKDGKDSALLQVMGYTNEAFKAFIDGIVNKQYNALDASIYVMNATRVPGLQRQYCDPFQNQCDFGVTPQPQQANDSSQLAQNNDLIYILGCDEKCRQDKANTNNRIDKIAKDNGCNSVSSCDKISQVDKALYKNNIDGRKLGSGDSTLVDPIDPGFVKKDTSGKWIGKTDAEITTEKAAAQTKKDAAIKEAIELIKNNDKNADQKARLKEIKDFYHLVETKDSTSVEPKLVENKQAVKADNFQEDLNAAYEKYKNSINKDTTKEDAAKALKELTDFVKNGFYEVKGKYYEPVSGNDSPNAGPRQVYDPADPEGKRKMIKPGVEIDKECASSCSINGEGVLTGKDANGDPVLIRL